MNIIYSEFSLVIYVIDTIQGFKGAFYQIKNIFQ